MDTLDRLKYIADSASWKQYVPEFNPESLIGISCPRFQKYIVHNQSGPVACNSMLTMYEIAVLYMLAKDYYSGKGEIVDCGPLFGVSTHAFARGLLQNNSVINKNKRINAFDLFLRSKNYESFIQQEEASITNSIFDKFLTINKDYLDQIVVSPGDFLKMNWREKPIEIFFIDIAKSWELNDHLVKTMFPFLIPGQSIIIQQDYVHYYEVWIHLLMELFSEYFEVLYYVFGASAVYRYTKKIPNDLIRNLSLRDLSLDDKETLLLRAQAKAPPSVKEVMKIAHAHLMISEKAYTRAEMPLLSVDFRQFTNDPTQDFSPIARANHRVVVDLFTKTGSPAGTQ